MDWNKRTEELAAQAGKAWAEQVGDRTVPEAWDWNGLTAEDLTWIADEAGPDEDGDEGIDTLDIKVLDQIAEGAFFDAMGVPLSVAEAWAAMSATNGPDLRWDDLPSFGGREPAWPSDYPWWTYDEDSILVGEGRDALEIRSRAQWAVEDLLYDGENTQRPGCELLWTEILAAVDRGEDVRGLPELAALTASTADAAVEAGWDGLYPAALRAAAIIAKAVSEHDKPTRGAVWAAVAADMGDRVVGYWLSGDRPIPWSAWRALRLAKRED